MKGAIWRCQWRAVLYSATEKGDGRWGPGAAGDEVTAPGRVGGSLIPRATAGQEAPEEPYFGHLEIQVMAEALFYRGLRGLSKEGWQIKSKVPRLTAQAVLEAEGPPELEPGPMGGLHIVMSCRPPPSPSSLPPTPTSNTPTMSQIPAVSRALDIQSQ